MIPVGDPRDKNSESDFSGNKLVKYDQVPPLIKTRCKWVGFEGGRKTALSARVLSNCWSAIKDYTIVIKKDSFILIFPNKDDI